MIVEGAFFSQKNGNSPGNRLTSKVREFRPKRAWPSWPMASQIRCSLVAFRSKAPASPPDWAHCGPGGPVNNRPYCGTLGVTEIVTVLESGLRSPSTIVSETFPGELTSPGGISAVSILPPTEVFSKSEPSRTLALVGFAASVLIQSADNPSG